MSRPPTRWTPAAVWTFELLFRPWMQRRIASIHLAGLPRDVPGECAVVLAANHVGWWDAFILRELQRTCTPAAPLLTLMRECELRRYPFFRWLGVVGLDDSPGGLRRALREVTSITQVPPWISIFPQGRLWPSWRRPLGFRRGVEAFAGAVAPALVVPVGIHYEVLRRPQPAAFVHAAEPLLIAAGERPSASEVERRVAEVLGRVHRLLGTFGEEAPSRWPASPFEQLPEISFEHTAGASHGT